CHGRTRAAPRSGRRRSRRRLPAGGAPRRRADRRASGSSWGSTGPPTARADGSGRSRGGVLLAEAVLIARVLGAQAGPVVTGLEPVGVLAGAVPGLRLCDPLC